MRCTKHATKGGGSVGKVRPIVLLLVCRRAFDIFRFACQGWTVQVLRLGATCRSDGILQDPGRQPDHVFGDFVHCAGRVDRMLALRLLSLCLNLCMSGLSSFAEEIAGRNVVVWSDNTGAEAATRKGGQQPLGTLHAPRILWLTCTARRNEKF